jgi:hypothetical protein
MIDDEILLSRSPPRLTHSVDPVLGRMHPSAGATTSKARESSKPKDKWANYTSAKDLGFTDEADKTAYEVEQEVKGRAANAPGAWQFSSSSTAYSPNFRFPPHEPSTIP